VPAFTPDAVRELGGASLDQRVAAAERFAAATLPTTDEEIWRYSRIGELDLERFSPAAAERSVEMPGGSPESLAALVVDDASAADLFEGDAPDVFAELNRAFARPLVLRVPRGTVVASPVVVTHRITGDGSAAFPRLVIDAGADSEITVIERFVSDDGLVALVVPVVQILAQQAARIRYLAVNELGDATWQIGNQQAVGERDSSPTLFTVALGGYYARVRTESRLSGRGADSRQVALYFAGGDQMHDFRTIQDHDAPHTTSDLLFKGAVQDRSRSVYTGLIKIREHARGTAAHQTNRNLTLSEGAWAESVPNLDIETNDVVCSHASTVGPIDEEQRFYLESRGIEPRTAERLVVLGFFDEVLTQLPAGDLVGDLRSRVAAKLHLDEAGS
jgi:Fe-S cluster assembly protein SufD